MDWTTRDEVTFLRRLGAHRMTALSAPPCVGHARVCLLQQYLEGLSYRDPFRVGFDLGVVRRAAYEEIDTEYQRVDAERKRA
jgi:hypothetical protein